MDAVTYPNEQVITFIEEHYVPLRLDNDNEPFARDYNCFWTPTLIVLDQEGREYQRSIGFLEPDEIIPTLKVGLAKFQFAGGHYDAARLQLGEVLKKYPGSDAAPEALYFQGVNEYKAKDDPKELKKAYEALQTKYPNSTWAKRSVPYRNL